MKKLIIGLFVLGLTTQVFAQDPEILPEVVIIATNYKYLTQANQEEASTPVKMLRKKVATYDIKEQDFYEDDYDTYSVSFFIPQGKIVAAYDKDGKVIRTIEKFKNVVLPTDVTKAVAKRFPGWSISKDVYLIDYKEGKGTDKKYKLTLENGDQRIKVKSDVDGNFI